MRDFFGLKKYLGSKRVLVLMYHRVADVDIDPWQLAVSPANFNAQLYVLKKHYKVIPVEELVCQVEKKRIPSNAVCITFDDGYADNYEQAMPLLRQHELPATFFIASDYIINGETFWWEELLRIILQSRRLQKTFSVTIGNAVLRFDLDNDGLLTEDQREAHQQWIWPAPPPTKRAAAYLAIWEKLRPMIHDDIVSVLGELKQQVVESVEENQPALPMTSSQLQELAREPQMSLGLHTASHPDLSCHSSEMQRNEIVKNKKTLEQLLNRSVQTISYPYGASNDDTSKVLSDLGLQAAFTTKEKVVIKTTPIFRLSRYQARNIDGDMFEKDIARFFQRV